MSADFMSFLQRVSSESANAERLAALALHEMVEVDRQWVLQQLTAQQQSTMRRLLHELRDLHMNGRADSSHDSVPMSTSHSPNDSPRISIERLTAHQARRTLAAEPDALVADLLIQGPFPWQSEFLALLPMRRRAIESAMAAAESSAQAPKRLECVLRSVAQRIAPPSPADAAATRPVPKSRAWRSWFRLLGYRSPEVTL